MSEEVSELDTTENPVLKRKEKKPGIIYLNYIPRYMNVVKVRDYFSDFGEVRRIYLKPDRPPKRGKPSKFFSEGWVEFASRKIAKRVAESLNNSQVGGRRNTPYFDALWSIRYLPKFQWSQLHEREAYQKAEARQRMRAEIAQTKREINFYSRAVDMEKRRRKRDKDRENTIEMDNVQLPLQAEPLEISPEDNKDDREKNIAKSFFI
ncbi:activator of basal transcription 1 [Trichonephila inaurata madagascariensis]|uniref:Activator of basal transcription 1 n=1 Tax=Trichonephila inaurata madagascariensis TaxID=2747483 RepID=A0A8X7BQB2_9ARAC|nr:activator of basal transcription 1 [Trichonephila inaurata madagascariensis]